MSNLVQRVLVAIVAIPLVVWIVLSGGWYFAGFVALLAALGSDEFHRLALAKTAAVNRVLLLVCSAALPLMCMASGTTQMYLVATAVVLLVMTAELWRNIPNPLLNIAATLGGIAYVGGLFSSLVMLRNTPLITTASASSGAWLVMSVFLAIWTCDSAAYFAGLAFGKHKIFPRVSPKKSWEGSIAGALSATALTAFLLPYVIPGFALHHAIAIGAIAGVVGQIGDFAESLLKRDANIKDSSSLIPGHGGILDRFDSVLFVAPSVLLYCTAFGLM
ncbi:MAG: phosphatidate cytidylyltransferase [Candidatus Kapabacteria bacterium]|nr:phosphatidate cytidylyltransferase [Candidatus Kapabacteria bacterium]